VVEGLVGLPDLRLLKLDGCMVTGAEEEDTLPLSEEEQHQEEKEEAEELVELPQRSNAASLGPWDLAPSTPNPFETSLVPRDRSLFRLYLSYSVFSQRLINLLVNGKDSISGDDPSSPPPSLSFTPPWQYIFAQQVNTLTHLHLSDNNTLQHIHLVDCYHLLSVSLLSMEALTTVNLQSCVALREFTNKRCPHLKTVSIQACSRLPLAVWERLSRGDYEEHW